MALSLPLSLSLSLSVSLNPRTDSQGHRSPNRANNALEESSVVSPFVPSVVSPRRFQLRPLACLVRELLPDRISSRQPTRQPARLIPDTQSTLSAGYAELLTVFRNRDSLSRREGTLVPRRRFISLLKCFQSSLARRGCGETCL